MTVKPVTTRKLRRRPNDPLPVPEKRGKPSPDILFVCWITAYCKFSNNIVVTVTTVVIINSNS